MIRTAHIAAMRRGWAARINPNTRDRFWERRLRRIETRHPESQKSREASPQEEA